MIYWEKLRCEENGKDSKDFLINCKQKLRMRSHFRPGLSDRRSDELMLGDSSGGFRADQSIRQKSTLVVHKH